MKYIKCGYNYLVHISMNAPIDITRRVTNKNIHVKSWISQCEMDFQCQKNAIIIRF
jgi:hypothetical protein